MNKNQLDKCSIKAVVDLIKDVGYGVTLTSAAGFLSKQDFFGGTRAWFLLPIFIAGIFIIVLSPIDFHKKYFDTRDGLLKRFISVILFFIIFFPASMILCISMDYSQYIASLPK